MDASDAPPYGTDDYWEKRYAGRGEQGDCTDEWLLTWDVLEPLLRRDLTGATPSVLDVGCGKSTLAFDLCGFHPGVKVVACDNSASAISTQTAAQMERVVTGEWSAERAEFCCFDATSAAFDRSFDVVIDKSTTDGLLCDTTHGAQRVQDIYANIGRTLKPSSTVAVVSWRDPSEDGVQVLIDLVYGPLKACAEEEEEAKEAEGEGGCASGVLWALDVHSIVKPGADDEQATGPHVYVLRRRPCRRSRRRRRQPDGEEDEIEEELVMRQHFHEVDA